MHAALKLKGLDENGDLPQIDELGDIMVDITPYAIGVITPISRRIFYDQMGEFTWWVTRQENSVVIPEYSPIPFTARTVLHPPQDKMSQMKLYIVQGSNVLAR